jgi:hypothetical protein
VAGSAAFDRSFVRHAHGVFRGATRFSSANSIEIRAMGNRRERAIGFGGLDAEHGAASRH